MTMRLSLIPRIFYKLDLKYYSIIVKSLIPHYFSYIHMWLMILKGMYNLWGWIQRAMIWEYHFILCILLGRDILLIVDVACFKPITRTSQTWIHRLPRTLELWALFSCPDPIPWAWPALKNQYWPQVNPLSGLLNSTKDLN